MRRISLPPSRAGRALILFWAVLLAGAAATAGALQWLGPPRPRPVVSAKLAPKAIPHAAPLRHAPMVARRMDIAPPDAALLEPAPHLPGALLPRIAADGRRARQVYAAVPPVVPPGAARIAVLMGGIGLSPMDSLDAVDRLPSAISLAVSPYSASPTAVLEAARRAGHEVLISLPMAPSGEPQDDEGARALTEQVGFDENRLRLEWVLSRIQGYAGATNEFVGLGGERFAGSHQFEEIGAELRRRGLFYLDATPDGTPPQTVPAAVVDLRLDDPPDAASIDGHLGELERLAQDKGSAIGVAGPLRPVTIERLADWAHGLAAHGMVLVPVSSLIHDAAPTAVPPAPRPAPVPAPVPAAGSLHAPR